MSILFLARHAETVWHEGNRYAGSSDIALTERGAAQSQALARWAVATGIDEVVSSQLTRAVETAQPSADALGVSLIQDDRLREVHFGDGEGLTAAEMADRFPEALRSFHEAPASSPLPHAEPGADAVDRAWPALQKVADDLDHASLPGREGRALVVMHSTVMRLVLCRVLDMPLDNYRRSFPAVVNVATSAIRLPGEGRPHASLLSYNNPV